MAIIDFKFTKNKINNIENNLLKSITNKINNIENNKLQSITEKVNNIENNLLKSIINKINNIENNKLQSITEKVNNIGISLFFTRLKIYNSFFDIDNFISLMNKGIKKYFNQNIRKFELLYQASIDGFGEDNFHKKCDGIKNTIVLIITDKNRIFGGFTELEWDNYSGYKEGNKGFIFSINDNKIYYNKSKFAIYCKSHLEPQFVDGFSIYSFYNENHGYDLTTYKNDEFNTEGKEEALAGEFKFKIKDYAVFQIYLKE